MVLEVVVPWFYFYTYEYIRLPTYGCTQGPLMLRTNPAVLIKSLLFLHSPGRRLSNRPCSRGFGCRGQHHGRAGRSRCRRPRHHRLRDVRPGNQQVGQQARVGNAPRKIQARISITSIPCAPIYSQSIPKSVRVPTYTIKANTWVLPYFIFILFKIDGSG